MCPIPITSPIPHRSRHNRFVRGSRVKSSNDPGCPPSRFMTRLAHPVSELARLSSGRDTRILLNQIERRGPTSREVVKVSDYAEHEKARFAGGQQPRRDAQHVISIFCGDTGILSLVCDKRFCPQKYLGSDGREAYFSEPLVRARKRIWDGEILSMRRIFIETAL